MVVAAVAGATTEGGVCFAVRKVGAVVTRAATAVKGATGLRAVRESLSLENIRSPTQVSLPMQIPEIIRPGQLRDTECR